MGLYCLVIGSALTGKLVSLFDYRAILLMLSRGRLDAARHAAAVGDAPGVAPAAGAGMAAG